MNSVFFSIVVVCLNSGDKLLSTVRSILDQEYGEYEIIIKDGGSDDGSLDWFINGESDKRIRIYQETDKGIYDAMNQAVAYAKGGYYLFLNTGDSFYNKNVLKEIAGEIEKNNYPDIIYGNIYHKMLETVIYSSPEINDFTCYRNVPCHQTCFYSKAMFEARGYNTEYNVRADYEHFLYCFYEKKAVIKYVPVTVASYEGGGYSETAENKKLSAIQHREITEYYMGKKKAYKYRLVMIATLSPVRSAIAENRYLSGIYNHVKTLIYKMKG